MARSQGRAPPDNGPGQRRDCELLVSQSARTVYADTLEELAYGAENGTWRNFFLSGATELREGNFGTPAVAAAPAIVAQLNRAQLLDSLATSLKRPGDLDLALDVTFTDIDSNYRLTLRNGVLIYVERPAEEAAGATLTLTKARMIGLLGGDTSSPASTSSET